MAEAKLAEERKEQETSLQEGCAVSNMELGHTTDD
jgi:hypothetical protein